MVRCNSYQFWRSFFGGTKPSPGRSEKTASAGVFLIVNFDWEALMEFKRRGSIRITLIAMVVGVTATIVVAFAIVFGSSLVNSVRERGSAVLEAGLRGGASGLRTWLSAKADSIRSYGDVFALEEYEKTSVVFLAAAEARGARDPEIYSLYFGPARSPAKGGVFLDGSGWVPPEDYDWTGRDWYLSAAAARDVSYSEPYIDADTGKLVFTVSMATRKDGTVTGVVGADIFMTTFGQIVEGLKPTPSAVVQLIDAAGLYVTNKDASKVLETDFFSDAGFIDSRQALSSGDIAVLFLDGQHRYVASILIPELDWRLVAYGDLNDILGDLNRVRNLVVGVSAGALILAFILTLLALSAPLRHIRVVVQGISAIAAGGGDLTKVVSVGTRDEIGELAHTFNTFLAYLDDLLRQVHDAADTMDAVSQSARDRSVSISEGMGDSADALDEAIARVRDESQELRRVAEIGESFFGRYRDIQDRLLTQAASVEETAAAMVQISRTMENVAILGKKGQDLAVELDGSARKSAEAVTEVVAIIGDIGKRSEAVASFAGVIAEIAKRTNLLAMNAAIEAAHAGESGKGFAVVAEEIRKLAESSNEETAEIARTVTEIGQTIERGVELSLSAEGDIGAMIGAVEQSRNVSMEISNATSEEARGGEEILKALSIIREANAEVKDMLSAQGADSATVENALRSALEGNERVATSVELQGSEIVSLGTRMRDFSTLMETVAEEANRLSCLMANVTLRDVSR
ncbi:MAG: methyl-accepting chemotaxis protein [Spirochaetales bacterium]|nr:MAG: methyl-accepting chemotaxis protein [Spirochaetales bacterium]